MIRVLLGIIKGGAIGVGVGLAATKLGLASGPGAWVVYGALGFLVGVLGGKALWRHETIWTPILKGIFGVLISLGLYWVARKVLGGVSVPIESALWKAGEPLVAVPVVLAPIIGILYGTFVEVDDGERKGPGGADQAKQA
jgi:hypothetical protein